MKTRVQLICNIIVALGACAIVIAGATLVGSIGRDDEAVSGTASLLFSFGALAIGGGLYQKARSVLATRTTSAPKNAKPALLCAECGTGEAVVFCTPHSVRLCVACMTTHDNSHKCLYVPVTRRFARSEHPAVV
jgi:hypothetical protein